MCNHAGGKNREHSRLKRRFMAEDVVIVCMVRENMRFLIFSLRKKKKDFFAIFVFTRQKNCGKYFPPFSAERKEGDKGA